MTAPMLRRGLAVIVTVLAVAVVAGCGSSPAPEQPKVAGLRSYVALGDSYTAAPLVPTTETYDRCMRSSKNYPSILAADLGVEHFVDRSCGGARTTAMTTSQSPGIGPQLDALKSDTDLVTLGVGVNDFGVATLVGSCALVRSAAPNGSPCKKGVEKHGKDKFLAAMPQIRDRVVTVLHKIKQRSPHARIMLIGYPRSIPTKGHCADLPIATGDYAYVRHVSSVLNDSLHAAAERTGVTWVDVWSASKGHDICSPDPWVNGAQTLKFEAAAYHPFGEEQAAVAKLILAKLS